MVKYRRLLTSLLLLLILTGCGQQSRGSISASEFSASWTIGKKYHFDFEKQQGRGWSQTGPHLSSIVREPIKVRQAQKELPLTLRHYPDAITFCFIDQVLINADITSESAEEFRIPLGPQQLTPGLHQINLMQFKQDDSGLPVTMNHLIKYRIE
ncbi:hypothetical protein [Lapidilactobacillus gannanensis]|uniref:Lipoprotein n=1 Tax=Lapidilactobacillus gannanensis TaxID=2486002 RepID=A0ABW4BMF6_9LACO|nr:hypothetical protein [Lapidilactobacillus gannanensis]